LIEINSFVTNCRYMLRSIYIDNYALIEKLEIDFKGGLSIITGETGAGKSILLGALGLLLGKRAETNVLKDTNRKCVVEGGFFIEGYGLKPFFTVHDLEYQNDTLVRREISNNGKSRAFINDTPVNLDVLQELSLSLIDVHSQHQNLLLNDEKYLRWIIDCYAGTMDLAAELGINYRNYLTLKKQYLDARLAYQSDKENLDYLTHQFTELNEAHLRADELQELEQEYDQLNHAEEIKSGFENVARFLQGESDGIIYNLKYILDILSRVKNHFPDAEGTRQRIESSYIELKDINSDVNAFFEKVEFDPSRMETIKYRIDNLNTLLRKYKAGTIAELIAIEAELDKKLQDQAMGDYELDRLLKALTDKEKHLHDLAAGLSKSRQLVFPEFETKIVNLLRLLGMNSARFEIKWQQVDIFESGIDRIQFTFSANANIALQNIAKIASGGELSRLMLAIKYLISNSSALPTIIFDEVDSGVSGDIADKVGNLIKEMADKMQVINITHLPQVASKGEHHYLVYKSSSNGTTKTFIRLLDEAERIREIAKMLSGDSISEAAIENAKVLLRKALKGL
jgi:DNA repair protein RecN (Recombination protein N)